MRLIFCTVALMTSIGLYAEERSLKIFATPDVFGAVTDQSGATNYNYHFIDAERPTETHILSFVEEPGFAQDRALQALINGSFHGRGKPKVSLYVTCKSEPFCWEERGQQICSYMLKHTASGNHSTNCRLTQYYVGEFK